jgi:ATP-dependent DNA helicase DinG
MTDFPRWAENPRAPEWGDPPLPEWTQTFRAHQLQAVQQVVAAFEGGNRIVVMEAPTGSGKTLVAELARRLLSKRALYTCVDRGLQDQFVESFPYARVLKGRRNYPTLRFPERFTVFDEDQRLTAEDCNGVGRQKPCDYCKPADLCPYKLAKAAALHAPLACTNLAYLLTEANGPGQLSGADLIVVDEADRLEGVLMDSVSLRLSERLRKEIDAPLWPDSSDLQTRAGAAAWDAWLGEVQQRLAQQIAHLEPDELFLSVPQRRRLRRYQNAYTKIDLVRDGLDQMRWVLETAERYVAFKAVRVGWAAETYLWQHGTQWLLMSATVLNATAMLRDLGITEGFAVVRMPSTFPVARRPVYFTPVANVVRQEEDAAVPRLVTALRQILARHPADRILVHVVSYRLMHRLREALTDEIRALWYAGSDARVETLEQYLSEPAAVLFAPALERGLDLPDEACRVVVVAKIPYPNLGDPQVRARVDHWTPQGREWYTLQTLRALVQMTGRGMRHADDYCTSYILDAQFETIQRRDGRLLPKWWTEAVQSGVLA